MKNLPRLCTICLLSVVLIAGGDVRAQFTAALLSNESYWSDGKAEFDLYEAELARGGQPRRCEMLMILAREAVDPKSFGRVDARSRSDAIPTVRFQQLWTVPLGLLVEQGSLMVRWRVDSAALLQLSFAGTDTFGNISRRLEASASPFVYTAESPAEGVSTRSIPSPANAVFYDELPLRVRTIDWRKPPADFEVQLAPSLVSGGAPEFKEAKVNWRPLDRSMEVTVQHFGGIDRFRLDRQFPFLLREWQMADGSHLKLKRSLKADYWNYAKNGDRERALKNPMLEHPD